MFRAEQIVLSSNWQAAIEVAANLGVRTHRRDERLCLSNSSFNEVILDSTQLVESTHMIWAPVTSPFFGSQEMLESLSAYLTSDFANKDGLLAVAERRSYFFLENVPINFSITRGHSRTQDIAPLLDWSWAFSIREASEVRKNSYMSSSTPKFFVSSSLSNLDIDDEEDFLTAQALIPFFLDRARAR